jgi:leucyl aminopeptidase
MVAKFENEDWRKMLPDIYSWLSENKIKLNETPSNNNLFILPTSSLQDVSESIKKENLLTPYANEFITLSKALGLQFIKSITLIPSTKATLLLVPISNLTSTPSQISRQIGLDASHALKNLFSSIVICQHSEIDTLDVLDGLCQGWYRLTSFKNESKKITLPNQVILNASDEQLQNKISLIKATIISRFIGDAPPNWMRSERFAQIAKDIAKEKNLKVTILGREDLKKKGLGAFCSVADGTSHDPKLIALEIKGKKQDEWVALVGKGLTFDSGGISLKRAPDMDEMKYDLCGGAAVLGAAYCLADIKPATNVVCLIGAVENMPGNSATRPGDIVKSYSGKTIEVLNTDAEGRLVLADLLHYANLNYKPTCMVDVATLTGAVLMSLGSIGSAAMFNNKKVRTHLLTAAQKTGEPMWELPLWPEFEKEIKSSVADLKNITSAGVKAGTITAGIFLKAFVGKTPWCHLDIAGTGWKCQALGFPKNGGSAFGVRTLSELCLKWS